MSLKQRVEAALEKSPTIVATLAELRVNRDVNWQTEEQMAALGLSKSDLKKLARHGLAKHAYSKNAWLPGEELPDGTTAKGDWLKSEITVKHQIGDTRGYTRTEKEKVEINVPTVITRGSGQKSFWILVA